MRGAWLGLVVVAACGDNLRGNRAPTADDFTLTTLEDIPITRAIAAADLDGDDLVALAPLPPMHGRATASGLSITYTPDADFHGEDQFLVPISDGIAETNVTVHVAVTSVNDAPFGEPDSLATLEDTARVVQVSLLLANDSDRDGDTLSIAAVGTAVHGTVALAGDLVTFTPEANFNGGGSFLYDLTDGVETVQIPVSVVIDAQNDPPVAVDDAATTPENTPLALTTLALTGNDTDVDNQTLTISQVKNATNGTVVLVANNVTFTPAANFIGDATFEYVVTDGIASDTGLVTVTVTAP